MKTLKVIFVLFLVSLASAGFAQTKKSEIRNISAKLFYNGNNELREKNVAGNFSENIIDNPDFTLWNIIIGAGSAEGYSNQTIVIVTVYSEGLSNQEQTLKLTATANRKVISKESRKFDCIGDNVEYKMLFLLNDTGCDEIILDAELINSGKIVSSMSKTINFGCGE